MGSRDTEWVWRREKSRSPEKKDRRSALNELSNLPQDVQDLYLETEHEVTKHRVENESLKEAVVLLRSQQQGLQDELKETHQKLRDKENELSKAKERAEELHQDLIKEQSNVVRLESMVVRVKQEKSQFEKELIASQKRTEDEVSRMERSAITYLALLTWYSLCLGLCLPKREYLEGIQHELRQEVSPACSRKLASPACTCACCGISWIENAER
eukprot:748527-Rhodomonas_salina.2